MSLLQAIAEMPEAVLNRGLTHVQAAEFLYETSLFPERIYIFKHVLTHEMAYGSLLQERRRMLHAQIVEALEALADDRWADIKMYREMEMTFWLPETEAALAAVEGKA